MTETKYSVVLQGALTLASVKLSWKDGVLRAELSASLPDATEGEYYFFAMNSAHADVCYRLGKSGNLNKMISERCGFVPDDQTVCAVCEVAKAFYSLKLLGGHRGKNAYLQLVETYFKSKEFYLPDRKITDMVESVEVACTAVEMQNMQTAERAKMSREEPSERLVSRSVEEKLEKIEKILDSAPPIGNFYDRICPQLVKIFKTYEIESDLEEMIDDSRWAKVVYGDGGEYYTVGVIYAENSPRFIGYGVPGKEKSRPPKELEGFCEWLPVGGGGYWMMYQSADNGENVRIERI